MRCLKCGYDHRDLLTQRIISLESELAVARERLGPAGYKILERYKEMEVLLRKSEAALEKAEKEITLYKEFYYEIRRTHGHTMVAEAMECRICDVMEQVKDLDRHYKEETLRLIQESRSK